MQDWRERGRVTVPGYAQDCRLVRERIVVVIRDWALIRAGTAALRVEWAWHSETINRDPSSASQHTALTPATTRHAFKTYSLFLPSSSQRDGGGRPPQ